MKNVIKDHTEELKMALDNTDDYHKQVLKVIKLLRKAFAKGSIVYAAGNGGSATLAQHLSDEAVGRYKENRKPYPVVALTADSAVITCIGNDYGYDEVFARQLEALGKRGDVLIAYSTSGNSKNILKAVKVAKRKGIKVVAFTGNKGKLKNQADVTVISPGKSTARIQELDLHAIHLIFEAFEPNNIKKKA